jgi:Rieske Fe-S protein
VYQDVTDEFAAVPTRRAVLATGAAGAGALALAACGGSGGSGTSARPGAAGSSTVSQPPAGKALTSLSDIKIGQAVSVTLPGGSPALVSRPSADTVACFSAICTHMGCTVKPDGDKLHCPCHGSMFDPSTGEVTHGPAKRSLPAVPVHLAGGKVVTGA